MVAASSDLLDPLEKRDVLYGDDTPAEELIRWGRSFAKAGFPMDALDFFVQAKASEELEEMERQALEQGDLFAWRRARQALGKDEEPELLQRLAENAEKRGRVAFARRARGEEPAGKEGDDSEE